MGIIDKYKQWRVSLYKKRLQKRMTKLNPNPKIYLKWLHHTWGDSIQIHQIYENNSFRVVGWLPDSPRHGDILHFETVKNKIAWGYFANIEYCRDPRDMFFADILPIDYVESEK